MLYSGMPACRITDLNITRVPSRRNLHLRVLLLSERQESDLELGVVSFGSAPPPSWVSSRSLSISIQGLPVRLAIASWTFEGSSSSRRSALRCRTSRRMLQWSVATRRQTDSWCFLRTTPASAAAASRATPSTTAPDALSMMGKQACERPLSVHSKNRAPA